MKCTLGSQYLRMTLLLLRILKLQTLVILMIIGSSVYYVQAQTPDISFDHLTTNDGLPNGDINDIIQDQQGFMWFCTWDGLIRHDGYSFVTYKPDIRDSSSISSKLVYCIVEDPSGGLWVGTKYGLNFFDRKKETFHRYFHEPGNDNSLLSNWVIDLVVDKDSNLWLATDQGLSQMYLDKDRNPLSFQHYQQKDKQTTSPHKQVQSLMIDHANNLWVGTMNGLVTVDSIGELHQFNNSLDGDLANFAGTSITAIYEAKDHHIWIGIKGGQVYEWDQRTQTMVHHSDTGPYTPESNKYVSAFCEDEIGNVWIGIFESGIYVNKVNDSLQKVEHDSKMPTSLKSNQVKSLYNDKTGVLWVGMEGQGISKLNLYRKPFTHYYHQSDDPQSLNFNTVLAFAEDPLDRIWVGTKEGINVFHPDENKFVHYEIQTGTINPLITDKIWSLYADQSEARMWIGGHYGLTVFNLKKDSKTSSQEWIEEDFSSYFKHILLSDPSLEAEKHQVRSIYRDRSGLLWVGTYHGLYVLKTKGDTVSIVQHYLHDPADPQSLSNDICIAIIQDSYGDMWIGTRDGGLNQLVIAEGMEKGKFVRYMAKPDDYNSLSNNEVASIHEDKAGNLWIGTAGGALNKLERYADPELTGERFTFTHLNEEDGLLADAVFGILEDDAHNLWLSTNNGLFKFDPRLSRGQQFKQFTNDHGLQSNMFFIGAFYKSKSGHMYFGGQNGFNKFDPDSITENKHLPQVVITELEIFNKAVKVGDTGKGHKILEETISESKEIHLSYKANNFSLSFAALHYSSPENNKYAYKLEGYDEEWIYTDANRRYVSYNNLKPGTYIFKVKASNSDNIWNEEFTQLIIHTGTPPWKSWWAIILYGLCLLSFLFTFRYYTLNKIRLENDLAMERGEHQKSEEINQMKLDFFTQLSHEFRTPLTLIIGPVQELVEKGKKLNKTEVAQHIKLINFNARHLLRLIDQLLYFSKSEYGKMKVQPESGDLIAFAQQVCDAFSYVAHKNGIRLNLQVQQEELNLWLDWDKMEKIFNNLLSNALKFTPDKGEVQVRISSEETPTPIVQIEVKDNGVGIPPEQISLIFNSFYRASEALNKVPIGYGIGLALTKKLVELHEGKITVCSTEGAGTTFTVQLPYEKCRIPAAVADSFDSANSVDISGLILPDVMEVASKKLELSNPKNSGSKPMLLIVDDNPEILSYLAKTLSDTYQILQAVNGEDAWKQALIKVPTMIISDVMMPKMDGIQLCSLLKSDERTNHIPVILLTAKSRIEHRIEGLQSGADAYLPKPFHPRHLRVRIEKLIELRMSLRNKYLSRIYEERDEERLISEDETFLKKVSDLIQMRLTDSDFKVHDLELELGMSHMQLYRKLKALTGQSANEFIRTVRLKKATELLKTTHLNVNEVAYQAGFNSPSYFIKCFRKEFGVLPKLYSMGHKQSQLGSQGETII